MKVYSLLFVLFTLTYAFTFSDGLNPEAKAYQNISDAFFEDSYKGVKIEYEQYGNPIDTIDAKEFGRFYFVAADVNPVPEGDFLFRYYLIHQKSDSTQKTILTDGNTWHASTLPLPEESIYDSLYKDLTDIGFPLIPDNSWLDTVRNASIIPLVSYYTQWGAIVDDMKPCKEWNDYVYYVHSNEDETVLKLTFTFEHKEEFHPAILEPCDYIHGFQYEISNENGDEFIGFTGILGDAVTLKSIYTNQQSTLIPLARNNQSETLFELIHKDSLYPMVVKDNHQFINRNGELWQVLYDTTANTYSFQNVGFVADESPWMDSIIYNKTSTNIIEGKFAFHHYEIMSIDNDSVTLLYWPAIPVAKPRQQKFIDWEPVTVSNTDTLIGDGTTITLIDAFAGIDQSGNRVERAICKIVSQHPIPLAQEIEIKTGMTHSPVVETEIYAPSGRLLWEGTNRICELNLAKGLYLKREIYKDKSSKIVPIRIE